MKFIHIRFLEDASQTILPRCYFPRAAFLAKKLVSNQYLMEVKMVISTQM
jgi:hypothetical protein